MSQEDKELLLIDLSARLPYGVKITWDDKHPLTVTPHVYCAITSEDNRNKLPKIFLRPMSSMTLEEIKYKLSTFFTIINTNIEGVGYIPILNSFSAIKFIDWLNKHHFDYRGLIEKGLALEAPEGMYKPAV